MKRRGRLVHESVISIHDCYSNAMNPKQRAAEAALELIESGMVVGLGTGSTADFFLQALGRAIQAGQLRDIRGIPTSVRSRQRSEELNIPLLELADAPRPDLTVDGADEVADDLSLIKGLGGALLREKIVAQNSRKLIIIADSSKRVSRLGTHAPLPVEVALFAHQTHETFLRGLGCEPSLRLLQAGKPFQTDNGNYIYDCRFPGGIEDPQTLQEMIRRRAGIVETGLFLGLASGAIIADENGVTRL
jgi:ribose 5-phosphate isomerase A